MYITVNILDDVIMLMYKEINKRQPFFFLTASLQNREIKWLPNGRKESAENQVTFRFLGGDDGEGTKDMRLKKITIVQILYMCIQINNLIIKATTNEMYKIMS